MQKWIESSWSDAIPVMGQFLHHRKAEDGLLIRVYEYMNSYQPEKEFSLVTGHSSNIPRFLPESNFDSLVSEFDNRMGI